MSQFLRSFLPTLSIEETNLSRAAFLSGCGMKLLLFLTSDLSLLSVPSKYLISLSFLINSFKSSVSFSAFPVGGVGVNFNLLSNKYISKSLSCLADRLLFMVIHVIYKYKIGKNSC